MKRLVILLPVVFLLLSLDRISPDRFPPPRETFRSWEEVAPTLPGRNEGRFGLPGDPLNLVFIGTAAGVRSALRQAGWTRIPTSTRGALAAGFGELLDGKPLASFPPMNDYRLLGRRQDMNWVRVVRPISERHHFRLWRTGATDLNGRSVWWGSGNYDLSIRWSDLSHRPDPDADRERDFVLATLSTSTLVRSALLTPLEQIPAEGVNDKGYAFRTDGRAAVIVLVPSRPSRSTKTP